ncbi:MAG: adenosylcobinamide-GDP ribazoletransferase [Gallionellaceae bacterium]|nr:adenosylcobinamide-GDP ribazoletransferase [Gallionellaceae bacterium]
MRGFFLALQFLTRIPVPVRLEYDAGALARSAAWFPAVGLLLGGLVAGAAWLGAQLDPWLGALLALGVWVWSTGGLHLDGLADLFDALGAAHRDRERFLEVLADPHLGAFGALALMQQLIAKLVLLMLLIKSGAGFWALVLIPAWARLGAMWWSQTLPPLKPGLGERFAWKTSGWVPWGWLAGLVAMALWLAPVLVAGPVLILGWRRFLSTRVGGMTGDCLGAGVEVTETLALLLLLSGNWLLASV